MYINKLITTKQSLPDKGLHIEKHEHCTAVTTHAWHNFENNICLSKSQITLNVSYYIQICTEHNVNVNII